MNACALTAERVATSMGPWQELAELARLAPTPHNTQPFRIRPLSAHVAQVVILRERMLPVEDTGNLYVLSSFGIFAETLECAGRHFGLEISVMPYPDVEPPPSSRAPARSCSDSSGSAVAAPPRTSARFSKLAAPRACLTRIAWWIRGYSMSSRA